VESILRALPLEGVVDRRGEMLYFPTGLRSGAEKPAPSFKAGSIAYWPICGGICLFQGEMKAAGKMSPVGSLKTEYKALEGVRRGASVRLVRL